MPSVYGIAWYQSGGLIHVLIGKKHTYNPRCGFIFNNGGAWCIPGGNGAGEKKALLELLEETGFDPCSARHNRRVSCYHRKGFSVFAYEVDVGQAQQYDYQKVSGRGRGRAATEISESSTKEEEEARKQYPGLGLWCSEFSEALFVPLSEAQDLLGAGAVYWTEEERTNYISLLPGFDSSKKLGGESAAVWQQLLMDCGRDAALEKLNCNLCTMRNDWFVDAITAFRNNAFMPCEVAGVARQKFSEDCRSKSFGYDAMRPPKSNVSKISSAVEKNSDSAAKGSISAASCAATEAKADPPPARQRWVPPSVRKRMEEGENALRALGAATLPPVPEEGASASFKPPPRAEAAEDQGATAAPDPPKRKYVPPQERKRLAEEAAAAAEARGIAVHGSNRAEVRLRGRGWPHPQP